MVKAARSLRAVHGGVEVYSGGSEAAACREARKRVEDEARRGHTSEALVQEYNGKEYPAGPWRTLWSYSCDPSAGQMRAVKAQTW